MQAVRAVLKARQLHRSLASGVTQALGEDLDAQTLAYRPELYPSGWRTPGASHGTSADQCLRSASEALRQLPQVGFALYNPLHVQPEQRNVLLGVQAYKRLVQTASDTAKYFLRATQADQGLIGMSHMRVVLASGPIMLSWLGAWREVAFTAAEEHSFRQVVPALAKRFRLEAELGLPGVTGLEAMFASLTAVDNPVFVLTNQGRALFANHTAVAIVDKEFSLMRELRDHVAGVQPSPRVKGMTTLEAPGGTHHVVLLRVEPRSMHARVRQAARTWNLTPSEAGVLVHLADGSPNKDIALKLGCAPRTIEVHIAALLRKSGRESRSQLIAGFWKEF